MTKILSNSEGINTPFLIIIVLMFSFIFANVLYHSLQLAVLLIFVMTAVIAAILVSFPLLLASFIFLILLPKSLPMLKVAGFEFGWGIGDLLLILLFIWIFSQDFLKRQLRFVGGINGTDKVIASYFLILLFPLLVGISRFPKGFVFEIASYVKYFEAFMIYYLIRKLVYKEKQIKTLLITFVFVAIGVIIIAAIQKFSPERYLLLWETIGSRSRQLSESFTASIGWRLAGPFFNANTLGGFLLISIPLIWYFYTKEKRRLIRLSFVFLIIISLVVLVFTGSRESYIGFLVSILIFMSFHKRISVSKSKFFIPILLIIIVFYFERSYLYHRLIEYTFGHQLHFEEIFYRPSTAARMELWKSGIFSLSKYWLTGSGLSQGPSALSEFLPTGSFALGGGTHNTYLRVFVEGGIITVGVFLYMLSRVWSLRKYKLSQPWEGLNYAFIAGFVGLCVAGLFGDTFQNIELMIPFFYLLGMLVSFNNLSLEDK